uniref:Ionotropic glutamate receptor L-glutamate and glycine-binding domain-containing protein n=1 Tax=Strigamia maritima TaxID=126957 RepID=T1JHW4_STRMM
MRAWVRTSLLTPCKIRYPPVATLIAHVNNSLTVGGYLGQIFNIFIENFNTSFNVTKCNDNQFGAFIKGNWTGMIKDIIEGTADIAASTLITRQKTDYVKFSPQLFTKEFFNADMWLSIIAISLFELLLCWPIVLQGIVCLQDSKTDANGVNCFVFYLGNFNSFSSKSMKLVFGIYIVFSMLLLVSYTSTLTSLLATTDTKIPFSSLEDMLECTDFLPVFTKGGKWEDIFHKSPYDKKKNLKVETLNEGIELVYSKKLALLTSLQSVENMIRRNCSLVVAPKSISRDIISIAYSKQFAYVKYFNYKYKCSENTFIPVSFSKIIGPFIFLMSVILMSLIFGIFELIIDKFTS